uniref:Uncharacterized protein n=1 Tax=Maylandia zebra TaxID=106582 RepID=A0A3P9BFH0_9CICH
MASALEQFVNNVRQLSAQGRVDKLIRAQAAGRRRKKEVYMVLILFFSCVSVSSNTLYEQQKQSISNTQQQLQSSISVCPGICSDSLTAQK